jgi:hypothetical protein
MNKIQQALFCGCRSISDHRVDRRLIVQDSGQTAKLRFKAGSHFTCFFSATQEMRNEMKIYREKLTYTKMGNRV